MNFLVEQICNKCGNENNNIIDKKFSLQSITFISPFVINNSTIYPAINYAGYMQNVYMSNNQNYNFLFYINSNREKNSKNKEYQNLKKKGYFDWICNRCNNLNYSFRKICNKCNLPKNKNIFYNSSKENFK